VNVNTKIAEPLFDEVARVIARRTGLHFPPERRNDLERGLRQVACELEFDDLETCLRWLASASLSRQQIETLASHLTIGETYFFRETKALEIVERQILPGLMTGRRDDRRLRFWSAGCCTGEEAYTLAILFARAIPDLDRWSITLLATDINHHFLSKAEAGIYTEWSFRNTPGWIRNQYFTKRNDGRFEIIPQLKKMVTFAQLNLAEDVFPSQTNNTNEMDVIVCRNVFMYLSPGHVSTIGRQFHECLIDSGYLLVSPSDTSLELASHFDPVHRSGAILYQRRANSVEQGTFQRLTNGSAPSTLWVADCAPHLQAEGGSSNLHEVDTLPSTGADSVARVTPEVAYENAAVLAADMNCTTEADKKDQVPDGGPEMALLARDHANRGNLGEALVWCDRAIVRDKTNPASHYLRATILQEQGVLDEAARALERALYLDPNFVLAHFMSGTVARLRGKGKASNKHFENTKLLLSGCPQTEILPESGGITVKRLMEIIVQTTAREDLR